MRYLSRSVFKETLICIEESQKAALSFTYEYSGFSLIGFIYFIPMICRYIVDIVHTSYLNPDRQAGGGCFICILYVIVHVCT